MTIETTRRSFMKYLGVGAAAAIIEEPVRKLWFVGSNAPVGSRIERVMFAGNITPIPSDEELAKYDGFAQPCGAIPLHGQYVLPTGRYAGGWSACPEDGVMVAFRNANGDVMGRVTLNEFMNPELRSQALEDVGFRLYGDADYHRGKSVAYETAMKGVRAVTANDEEAMSLYRKGGAGRLETMRLLSESGLIDGAAARELLSPVAPPAPPGASWIMDYLKKVLA